MFRLILCRTLHLIYLSIISVSLPISELVAGTRIDQQVEDGQVRLATPVLRRL